MNPSVVILPVQFAVLLPSTINLGCLMPAVLLRMISPKIVVLSKTTTCSTLDKLKTPNAIDSALFNGSIDISFMSRCTHKSLIEIGIAFWLRTKFFLCNVSGCTTKDSRLIFRRFAAGLRERIDPSAQPDSTQVISSLITRSPLTIKPDSMLSKITPFDSSRSM